MFLHIFLISCYAYSASILAIQISYRLFNKPAYINGIVFFTKPICRLCGKNISLTESLPVVNLISKQKQYKKCKHNIPILETIAFVFLAINYIISFFYFKNNPMQFVCFTLLLLCLTTQSLTDVRTMYSSDVIHILELILCITMSVCFDNNNILQIIIKTAGLFLFFVLNIIIMKFVLKKDSLGFGDVKLYLILSTLFTLTETMQFIAVSGLCGVLYYSLTTFANRCKKNNKKKHTAEFAFIPAIFIAFLLAFYFKHK